MIDNKIIKNAKYIADSEGNNSVVSCTINGIGVSVPLDPENTDYAEIMKQVADGDLTIADAE